MWRDAPRSLRLEFVITMLVLLVRPKGIMGNG
jgi:hypothetical protein